MVASHFSLWRKFSFVMGPLIFFLTKTILFACGFDHSKAVVMGTLLWMLYWWLKDGFSPAIPALLPFLIFPVFSIVPPLELAATLGSTTILLFLGGFVLASAIERWGLHLEFVGFLLRRKHLQLRGLLFVFIFVAAFASMWISNTAAVLILVPIIEVLFKDKSSNDEVKTKKILGYFILAAAYASSIGGLATLIGSPPNAIAANYINENGLGNISFAYWLRLSLPFALFSILLLFVFFNFALRKELNSTSMKEEIDSRIQGFFRAINHENKPEKVLTFLVLVLCVLAWLFLPQLSAWTSLKLNDSNVALAGALLLCMLPSLSKNSGQATLVSTQQIESLPWSTLFLFAGGLALSKGLQVAGWIDWLRGHLQSLEGVPPFMLLMSLVTSSILLTELMSNTALAAILVPWAIGFESVLKYPIVDIVMALCFASSLSFMLPVATPPNAIAFSRGHVRLKTMLKLGLLLNVVFAVAISLYVTFVLPLLK